MRYSTLILAVAAVGVPLSLMLGPRAADSAWAAVRSTDPDRSESAALREASTRFAAGDYRGARKAYRRWIAEFPESEAVPVARFRQARCAQLQGDHAAAQRLFAELAKRPGGDRPELRAAALLYGGECLAAVGRQAEGLAMWRRCLEDLQLAQTRAAGQVLRELAAYEEGRGRSAAALEYWWRFAVDQAEAFPGDAKMFREKTIQYLVAIEPDEQRLRRFWAEIDTEGTAPVEDHAAALDADRGYWESVVRAIRRFCNADTMAEKRRIDCLAYWVEAMGDRFPDWDDFRIERACLELAVDHDTEKWARALAAQYQRNSGEGPPDLKRLGKWLRLFSRHPASLAEFCATIEFGAISAAGTRQLVRVFFDDVQYPEMARAAFARLDLTAMTDADREDLARYLWHRAPDLAETVCGSFDDADRGRLEHLRYLHWRRDTDSALPICRALREAGVFPDVVPWMEAELLHWGGRHVEAAALFRACSRQPEGLLRSGRCWEAAGDMPQAATVLRDVARNYPEHAPEALLRLGRVAPAADERRNALTELVRQFPTAQEAETARGMLAEASVPAHP